MSFSNRQLPESFYVHTIPSIQQRGLKLSNFIFDPNKMLRLRMVRIEKNTPVIETSIPTIIFDINPKSISFGMSKSINSSVYTRAGFIPQFWGDELDTIQVQGTSAAFLHLTDGITRQNAKGTAGYSNFFNLILFYKNNGSVYNSNFSPGRPTSSDQGQTLSRIRASYKKPDNTNTTFFSASPRKIIDTRLLVELTYSTLKAYGTFNSFSYTETTEKAFNFDYNFEYTPLFYSYSNVKGPPSIEGHI